MAVIVFITAQLAKAKKPHFGGRIYTSAATTVGSPLGGATGTTTALQYIGNNQWQALTEATAASANSVAAANVTGTLAGTQIAPASITGTQLATGLNLGGTIGLPPNLIHLP